MDIQSTVVAASAVVQQDFWEWFKIILYSFQTQQFSVYSFFGIAGMVFHYFVAVIDDRINGSVWHYMFKDQPKKTFLAFLTLEGAGLALCYTGAADGMTWVALIGMACTSGYTADSTLNRGSSNEPSNSNNG